MNARLFLFFVLALPCDAGCTVKVFGLCSQYKGKVTYKNVVTPEETCSTDEGGSCKVPSHNDEGSWVPKAEKAADMDKGYAHITSEDGVVDFKLWHDPSMRQLLGGYDYGAAQRLALVCSEKRGASGLKPAQTKEWNVVVQANGNVTVWQSADHTSCPKPPSNTLCRDINSVQGAWVPAIYNTAATLAELGFGTRRNYDQTDTHRWGWNVQESLSGGFNVFGATLGFNVAGTQAGDMSRSYASSMVKSMDTVTSFGPFPAGQVWQWQFVVGDGCGTSTVKGADVMHTIGRHEPPCCLPGYFLDHANARGGCHAGSDGRVFDFCHGTEGAEL